MVDSKTIEWAQWILFFTLGGFLGNFVFSLTDHAQNGFFFPVEWVPVAASAIAVGFLTAPLLLRVSRLFIDICAALLILEAMVGLWGFSLHTMGNLRGPSVHALENFVYGAPPMAPLLFPNLMILGLIGLWQLRNNEGYLDRAYEQTGDLSRANMRLPSPRITLTRFALRDQGIPAGKIVPALGNHPRRR